MIYFVSRKEDEGYSSRIVIGGQDIPVHVHLPAEHDVTALYGQVSRAFEQENGSFVTLVEEQVDCPH